ncbi:hypothetical protein CR513_16052, partial [Mucuna pruriens]
MEHHEYNTSNTLKNDVYFQEKVSVPFSWEYKPGLSKVTHQNNEARCRNLVLQPPPRSSSRTRRDNKKIRVEEEEGADFILCAVQSSSLGTRSFRLESQKQDPFVEAYKKCTQTPKDHFMHKRQSSKSNKNNGSWPNIMRYMDIFSCKFCGDGKIPFSWERKPGVPKVTTIGESCPKEHKLQPQSVGNSVHAFQIPLPPYYTTFSKKGLIGMQDRDPFFEAYKKCTKSTKSVDRNIKLQIKTNIETRFRNSMSFISCKRSCAVRDNNLVRISHLPQNVDED